MEVAHKKDYLPTYLRTKIIKNHDFRPPINRQPKIVIDLKYFYYILKEPALWTRPF